MPCAAAPRAPAGGRRAACAARETRAPAGRAGGVGHHVSLGIAVPRAASERAPPVFVSCLMPCAAAPRAPAGGRRAARAARETRAPAGRAGVAVRYASRAGVVVRRNATREVVRVRDHAVRRDKAELLQ